jgi:hypothetical protein
VPEALAAYEKAGNVHEHGGNSAAIAGMVEQWNRDRLAHPDESHIMLAFRRDEVRALNDAARGMRQHQGELGPDHRVATEKGERDFATGDRLVFLQNDRHLGVKNGTLGTVEKMRGDLMTVRLDGPEQRRVAFDVREYNHLDHGYAVTAHKAQGITADRAHVLASDLFDQHVAYVALSRHRKQVDLHWSRDTFENRENMVRQLSRERMKDIALDHVGVERDNRELHAQHQRQPERQPEPERAPSQSPGPVAAGDAQAKEPAISADLLAKLEARVDKHEKELDRRLDLEERVNKREKELDKRVDKELAKERELQRRLELALEKGRGGLER